MSATASADGKSVVVVDGKRQGGVHESKESAEETARKLNKIQESRGSSGGKATVKTNLFG